MAGTLVDAANTMSRQHGLITREQLTEQVSPGQVHRLLRSGRLHVVRRGVYLLNGAPRSWSQALLAAVMAAGDDSLASHSSAARLWNFKVPLADDYLEITVPRPRRRELDGVRIHSSAVLPVDDRATRDGVQCTSFERTLCDSTTAYSLSQLGLVLDDGLRRKITTIERLRDCVRRLDSGPERRLSLVQRLLETRNLNYNPGGSGRELRVLDIATRANLPVPEQQVRVRVRGRTYFLDYAYRHVMRFVEYYELRSHGTPSAVAYDSDRITDLASIGWSPVIVTDQNSDREIATKIAAALGLTLPSDRAAS
jgi:predicted transcriptional regulator of viral defense system